MFLTKSHDPYLGLEKTVIALKIVPIYMYTQNMNGITQSHLTAVVKYPLLKEIKFRNKFRFLFIVA